MFFQVSLYVAISIFCFGLLFRVSIWFRRSLIHDDTEYSPSARLVAAAKGILATLFGPKIFILLKVFILDVLLQIRILKESRLRWVMHICICTGFMILLLMHALEALVSEALFAGYYSTLNPFLFIRDFSGIVVLFGIGIVLYRRFFTKSPRLVTNAMDICTILIISAIILSGILLQGFKIASYSEFKAMEEEYSSLEDPDEILALESYWVRHYGLVSPRVKAPVDPERLAEGRELHEGYCIDCHSSSKWALSGYATARIISPVALALDRANVGTVLLYIHFLASFIGLAWLPFGKMFHVISSPLALLLNAVMDGEKSDPANLAIKRMVELDACTHCGACSLRCSVGPVFEMIPNPKILPSEKIAALRLYAAGKEPEQGGLAALQEGLCLCTDCHRCTDVCPVGINLQDLWTAVREEMLNKKDLPELTLLSPFSIYRVLAPGDEKYDDHHKPVRLAHGKVAGAFCQEIIDNTLSLDGRGDTFRQQLKISIQGRTFSACYNCKTCTTACPLTHAVNHPQSELGLVPHQMMQAVSLGLRDLVLGSRMLWACLGCYQCQEQCPQGVRVTDVFYQLKNIAMEELLKNRSKI